MLAGASIFFNGIVCVLGDVETVARAAAVSVGRCDMTSLRAVDLREKS